MTTEATDGLRIEWIMRKPEDGNQIIGVYERHKTPYQLEPRSSVQPMEPGSDILQQIGIDTLGYNNHTFYELHAPVPAISVVVQKGQDMERIPLSNYLK